MKFILAIEVRGPAEIVLEYVLFREVQYLFIRSGDWRAAVEVTRTIKPDLLLFAYEVPEMNGLALYDLLHACPSLAAVPVLITCADEPLDAFLQETRTRGILVLALPVSQDLLLETVAYLCAA